MSGQDLFLAMVLAAFATFILTLGGVGAWTELRRPPASDK